MPRATILLLFVLTWTRCLYAADVVTLSDGDRLTGTVQKMEDGKLFFKSKHSETALQIDWNLVSGLTTESEVRITLRDGTRGAGRLLAAAGGMTLFASATPTTIQPSIITGLEPKAAQVAEAPAGWFREAWDNTTLSADFGQSYSGLAGYNQFSSNSEIVYQGDRWDGTVVTHHDYYGSTDSIKSTYQAYGRFVGQRYITGDRFFLFPYLFLGSQTTESSRGQIRQFGGGAGWTFRRQYDDQLSLYAGLIRSNASGFKTVSDGVRVDERAGDKLFIAAASWERTLKRKIETSVRLYYFKPVNKSGHHAMATDASAKIPLYGPAYFTVRAYDTPELRQRQLFSVKNLQISSGVGLEF
jgi:hypothetical protein